MNKSVFFLILICYLSCQSLLADSRKRYNLIVNICQLCKLFFNFLKRNSGYYAWSNRGVAEMKVWH